MLLGYKITLAFMRILSLLCVCFLSSFVSNVSAQVVEKVYYYCHNKSLCILPIMDVFGSFKRKIDGKFRKFSFCAVYEYSSLMRLYYLVNKV